MAAHPPDDTPEIPWASGTRDFPKRWLAFQICPHPSQVRPHREGSRYPST